jgi:hypothetical protein
MCCYFECPIDVLMFARRRLNKSGSISVKVISKIRGKSKLIKTIGSSKNETIVNELIYRAKEFINLYKGQQQFISFR